MSQKLHITLIGTPNVGKTSLFNYLTGENNLIGNWDGVTTDIINGEFNYLNQIISITDLPGCYSLVASEGMSLEEELLCNYLNEDHVNHQIFINVISSENLARDLYLTLQLLERNYKIFILLNIHDYKDLIINNSIHNHSKPETHQLIKHLASLLNCKIIPCNVVTGDGLQEFKENILCEYRAKLDPFNTNDTNNNLKKNLLYQYIPNNLIPHLEYLLKKFKFKKLSDLVRYLEGDYLIKNLYNNINNNINNNIIQDLNKHINQINKNPNKSSLNNLKLTSIRSWDVLFASIRHHYINNYLLINFMNTERSYTPSMPTFTKQFKDQFTQKIDAILLHKYYGLPIFISIIYLMFFYINKFGNILQQYVNDQITEFIIYPIIKLLKSTCCPEYLLYIFNDGIFIGLGTLFNFIPILLLMNISLLLLENCGYMIRAVFLLDKLMGFLGLPGKSIIPMIMGFGCNVPAINGAKVITNKRDKIITILMTPFMSCNARLVTYSFFATAFFKDHKINVIFYLYAIGIIFGIFTGFLLNKILKGSRDKLFIELPKYQLPSIKLIIKLSYYKIKNFINNTGFIIISICTSIAVIKLCNFKFYDLFNNNLFKSIILIFKPMGLTIDNWPAIASLFSGLIAKEAIVGSLYAYYYTNEQEIFGILSTRFSDHHSAFSYLLFILLSFPCVSVIASIAKELNKSWAIFSIIWNTWLAYFISTLYYQLTSFQKNPAYATSTLLIVANIFIMLLSIIKAKVNSFNTPDININKSSKDSKPSNSSKSSNSSNFNQQEKKKVQMSGEKIERSKKTMLIPLIINN